MPPSSKRSSHHHTHPPHNDAQEVKLVQSFLNDLQDARQRRRQQHADATTQTKKRRRSSDDDHNSQRKDPSATLSAGSKKTSTVKSGTMNKMPRKKHQKRSSEGDPSLEGVERVKGPEPTPELKQQKSKKKKSLLGPNGNENRTVSFAPTVSTVPLSRALSLTVNSTTNKQATTSASASSPSTVLFPHRYILAPMVGASELPFRLLCRKYGADVAYTPMLNAHQFVNDPDYAAEHCPLRNADAPLVAHFGGNDPALFAQAAAVAQQRGCVGCDLNLGCPQRTAYLGHYGSYLMDDPDLIVRMIQQAVQATTSNFAISVKIRLLDTCPDTIDFCRRLCQAGVALIAIHGRHRASWERTSAGARDGPADLAQIQQICDVLQSEFPHVKLITNGNTITWQNVQDNLQLTHAHGLMSAEGILDHPALFLPRHEVDGNPNSTDPQRKEVQVWTLEPTEVQQRKIDKLQSKLLKSVAAKMKFSPANNDPATLPETAHHDTAKTVQRRNKLQKLRVATLQQTWMPLHTLQETARDPLRLCHEYLDWVQAFPTALRTVIFHTRRMLKELLTQYQLMNECLQCQSVEQVRLLLNQLHNYREHPDRFVFDQQKAADEKQALERRRLEESKRKRYEERMLRKAKREGLADLHYYLKIGAVLPTETEWNDYQHLPREQVVQLWKERHGQHCLTHHWDGTCARGRACAFLHAEHHFTRRAGIGPNENAFVEMDEVAG